MLMIDGVCGNVSNLYEGCDVKSRACNGCIFKQSLNTCFVDVECVGHKVQGGGGKRP